MMTFGDKEDSNAVGGKAKKSLLDGLITGLFGPAKDEMTPEDAAKEEAHDTAQKKKASAMAVSGATNPGGMADSFMEPPVVSDGSDIIKMLAKIFAGGGGGG